MGDGTMERLKACDDTTIDCGEAVIIRPTAGGMATPKASALPQRQRVSAFS
jgi:hypothetical protein